MRNFTPLKLLKSWGEPAELHSTGVNSNMPNTCRRIQNFSLNSVEGSCFCRSSLKAQLEFSMDVGTYLCFGNISSDHVSLCLGSFCQSK